MLALGGLTSLCVETVLLAARGCWHACAPRAPRRINSSIVFFIPNAFASILGCATSHPSTSCRSACNTVVPKLVSQDYALFASLLNGVFPGCQVMSPLIFRFSAPSIKSSGTSVGICPLQHDSLPW